MGGALGQADGDRIGLAVSGNVGQGLLHDAVKHDFEFLGDFLLLDVDLTNDSDGVVPLAELPGVPLDGGQKPEVVDGQRAQIGRDALGLLDGVRQV
jgi:hypothetical protein